MSAFHESIKSIFSDVEKFLLEILKKDCKLSKRATEQKQQILDKLHKFYEEHPEMKPATRDNTSANDESSHTGGSSNTDEGEEATYIDAGIGLISATELKNPVFSGYLEKKQKKGSGLFGGQKLQSRWCILHSGVLYYYIKPEDKKQCGSFRVEGYKFRNAPDVSTKKKDKDLGFELYHQDEGKRLYQFLAKNKEDYENWKNFLDNDGEALIEEDLYEELESERPPPPEIKPTVTDGDDEIYEEPEIEPPPPSRPPPPSPRQPVEQPPPPPPPAFKAKVPEVKAPEISEEIYDDATSGITEEPVSPPIPPPTKRRPDMSLPELPSPKKQIKLNLTFKPEEDFENKFYGKFDCKGDNSSELSFKKGDMIHIISKEFDDKSWWIGEVNGKFGLVPKTFVTAAYMVLP